jgi:hypothetical protein
MQAQPGPESYLSIILDGYAILLQMKGVLQGGTSGATEPAMG